MSQYYTAILFIVIIILAIVAGLLLLNHRPILSDNTAQKNSATANITTLTPTPVSSPVPVVVVKDIIAAGFSGVEQQQPDNGRFMPPNLYFKVKQSTPNSLNGNLVMVLIVNNSNSSNTLPNYGANIKPFDINGGTGQEGIMPDGRATINFNKNSFYAVVIGPGQSEVEKLAQIISLKL